MIYKISSPLFRRFLSAERCAQSLASSSSSDHGTGATPAPLPGPSSAVPSSSSLGPSGSDGRLRGVSASTPALYLPREPENDPFGTPRPPATLGMPTPESTPEPTGDSWRCGIPEPIPVGNVPRCYVVGWQSLGVPRTVFNIFMARNLEDPRFGFFHCGKPTCGACRPNPTFFHVRAVDVREDYNRIPTPHFGGTPGVPSANLNPLEPVIPNFYLSSPEPGDPMWDAAVLGERVVDEHTCWFLPPYGEPLTSSFALTHPVSPSTIRRWLSNSSTPSEPTPTSTPPSSTPGPLLRATPRRAAYLRVAASTRISVNTTIVPNFGSGPNRVWPTTLSRIPGLMLVSPNMFCKLFGTEAEFTQRDRWSRGLPPLMVYARHLVERIDPDTDPLRLLLRTDQILRRAGWSTASVLLS